MLGDQLAALVVLWVAIAVAFTIYCIVDISRAASVRYLPKWLWVVICLISEPLGGIIYLIVGRQRRSVDAP